MANQAFDLAGALKVRPAEENDAVHLHTFCFPEKTPAEVAEELKADLDSDGQTHRLVAESSGYPIGQITVSKGSHDSEVAQVGNLAVSGPFRQLGVADYLIKAAEAAAAENGAKTLEIELASSETNVIQRYKDWGFVEKPIVILQKMLDAEEQEEVAEEVVEEETAEEVVDTDTVENPVTETAGEQQELLNA
ncbi:GNAT family N-acetyltransferase [Candidatus Poribacteria bacterium]|nr:GNAT family N-acetyltransferase [Candidatus Poribacteria bacterium]